MGLYLKNIHVFGSAEELNTAIAKSIASYIDETLKSRENFALVLAGGETPRSLYKFLAENYSEQIAWNRIFVYWSDERYVPYDDPDSNFRMAIETLLDHVRIPKANIHPIPTYYPEAAQAAASYEAVLRSHFSGPCPNFDLVLLGMGDDCHTASLFPYSAALTEKRKWVVTSESSKEPRLRVTLTLPAINAAGKIYFIVTGANKAKALKRAISTKGDAIACPAGAVRPRKGRPEWWIDSEAASLLRHKE